MHITSEKIQPIIIECWIKRSPNLDIESELLSHHHQPILMDGSTAYQNRWWLLTSNCCLMMALRMNSTLRVIFRRCSFLTFVASFSQEMMKVDSSSGQEADGAAGILGSTLPKYKQTYQSRSSRSKPDKLPHHDQSWRWVFGISSVKGSFGAHVHIMIASFELQ